MAIFHGTSIPAGATASYELEKSLRFNKGDSPNLQRSSFQPTSPYTASVWVKRSTLTGSGYQRIYNINGADHLIFNSDDKVDTERRPSAFITDRRFRDTSQWYHLLVSSTSSNVKLYVNGVLEDQRSSTANPYTAGAFDIGSSAGSIDFFDGYMAEFHWVHGTALTPSDFGVTGDYGEWKPKEYTGSHGSNGFHLDFANSGSLGNDVSGNGNHFTVSNITASDQMLDTPTNNFCTLNHLDDAVLHKGTFAEGSLKYTGAATGNPWGGGYNYQGGQVGTIYTSKKFYYEWYVGSNASQWMAWGIAPDDYRPSQVADRDINDTLPGRTHGIVNHGVSTDINYNLNYYDGSTTLQANQSNLSAGNIVMMAFDPATGKYWWGRNGTWENSGNPATGANPIVTLSNLSRNGVAHTWTAWIAMLDATHWAVMNFGQDSTFGGRTTAGGNSDDNGQGNFKYAVPTGFLALCKNNMDDPAVIPSENFNTLLYTGTGSSNAITGVGFQPDFVWIKNRVSAYEHQVYDSVRGVTKKLQPSATTVEATDANALTAFGSDGFTVGSNVGVNNNNNAHAAWNWKAGGAGSSNTNGSINTTSTSVNSDAGFSISTYTGNGSGGASIGHGLAKTPNLVIVKRRTGGTNSWVVGSVQSVASMDFTDYLILDGVDGKTDPGSNTQWNDQNPTSSVFYVGTNTETNHSGSTYVAYCFHSVDGYSRVGSYSGTGNTDGIFVYTGFKPAFILLKRINGSGSWVLTDLVRNPINDGAMTNSWAESSAAENANDYEYDFLSNGFKLRTGSQNIQSSGNNYIYYAVAEQPFKYSNAH